MTGWSTIVLALSPRIGYTKPMPLTMDCEAIMTSYGLREDVISFIRDSAQQNDMEEVILFGSRARGDFSEKSDIDLAVRGNCVRGYEEDLDERCPTLLRFDFVNLASNPSEALATRIQEEGVMLYG